MDEVAVGADILHLVARPAMLLEQRDPLLVEHMRVNIDDQTHDFPPSDDHPCAARRRSTSSVMRCRPCPISTG